MINDRLSEDLAKVPAVTLGFWTIKILATTLGETGGDTLSMTYNLGYLMSSAIFVVPLIVLVFAQVAAGRFHPFLYWAAMPAPQPPSLRQMLIATIKDRER